MYFSSICTCWQKTGPTMLGTWPGIKPSPVAKRGDHVAPAAGLKGHQYLQGTRPWPAAGQTERWCPSPRQPCPPAPGDGPGRSRVITGWGGVVVSIVALTSQREMCCVLLWTFVPRLWRCDRWRCPEFRRDGTWSLPQRIPCVCGWPLAWSCPGGCRSSGRPHSDHGGKTVLCERHNGFNKTFKHLSVKLTITSNLE